MESEPSIPPLIVIVGQTASGKSDLAVQLAKKCGGEIISADSRTIYKDMDIGTAKLPPAEQGGIKHHLMDIVAPDEPFNASDFKRRADVAIADIRSRGKIPFLVGGSGLYVDSVIFNYGFTAKPDLTQREKLNDLST
jgi:tRNA dimethylallyltransferase